MLSFRRILFRLCYQLRGHRWNGWPLDYWVSLALVLLAGLASLGVVPGKRVTIYAMTALLFIFWALLFWARRNQYVTFLPEDFPATPGLSAILKPADRIELRATGHFQVEGKKRRFSEIRAYFRTFATREHTVMAIVPPSRFLFLGTRPALEEGMWYIFFHSQHTLDVTAGTLHFGSRSSLALRVVYQAADGRKETKETIYLSFDERAKRQRVWADLQYDATLGNQPA